MAGPVIAAAGIAAAAGLIQHMMAQEEQRKAQRYAAELQREMFERQAREARESQARSQVAQAQQNQLGVAQRAGDSERDALAQLIAVFQRSAR